MRQHRSVRAVISIVLMMLICTMAARPAAARDADEHPARPQAQRGMIPILTAPAPGGKPDFTIPERLVELINDTPAGASIDVSMYQWGHTPTPDVDIVASAIADAQARGVHIRAAIDGGMANNQSVGEKILRAAGLDRLVYCSGSSGSTGCIANRAGGINHDKLFLFSQTGTMHDVSVVSSQNLTTGQNYLFQNALLFYGYTDLYQAFRGHMDRMLDQQKDNDYYDSPGGTFQNADDTVEYAMAPRADSAGGTSVEASTTTDAATLSRVEYEPGCQVSVAMGHIDAELLPAVEQLVRIADLGCRVRIVYMWITEGVPVEPLLQLLHDNPKVETRGFWDGTNPDYTASVHSKYISIADAVVDGQQHSNLVRAGSANWDRVSLRADDEITVLVKDDAVEAAYQANFEVMWQRAEHCINPPDDHRACRTI